MSGSPEPALGIQDVTWEDLRERAEGHWRLVGPDSSGGTTLYRYRGQLFIVGYGDHSSIDGAEQVIGVLADNTPGFAPLMDGGHAEFFVNGEEVFRCPATTFALKNSAESLLVLEHMGPNVMSEAQQCAERD